MDQEQGEQEGEGYESGRRGVDQTDTTAFKRWFGESVVVDESGNPLILYHGSNRRFSEFKPKPGMRRIDGQPAEVTSSAFFFTPDRDTARMFARDRVKIDQRLRGKQGGRAGTRAFFLSIQNPLDFIISPEVSKQIDDEGRYFVRDAEPNPYATEIVADIIGFQPETWQQVQEAMDDPKVVQELKDQDFDGVHLFEYNGSEAWGAFEPTQIKSATSNLGAFNPEDPNILANIMPTSLPAAVPGGHWLNRSTNRMLSRAMDAADYARVKLQDRALPIRRVQELIEKETGLRLPLNLDTYIAEALYHGRAGERLVDLRAKRLEPLIDYLRANGIEVDEIGDYLYARHAAERNAVIQERDPDNEEGSGMSDQEAGEILARVRNGNQRQAYEEAARMVDRLLKESRNTLLKAGLIDRETYETWRDQYSHYVPLRGWEIADEDGEATRPRSGRGFDIRGPEAHMALGRRSRADNPLFYVVLQAQEAIVRSEKNRVGKTLLRAVQTHPNASLWEIYKGEARRRFNDTTGLVETYWVPPQFARSGTPLEQNDLFRVKVGGKATYIQIHHEPLRRAMRNVGSADLQGTIVGRAALKLARTYAAMLTTYNPEFIFSNAVRDIQTALINISDVENLPEGTRRRIAKDFVSLKSIRGILSALRGEGASEYAPWFEEYRLAGGKVSYIELNDIERIKSRINKAVKSGDARRALRYSAELVEDLNSAVENGVRLSAYVALRKAGIAKERAAFVARELTVNFNRKGEWGPGLNAAYLFFNASAQGSMRIAQALYRSKAARYTVGALFFTGMALDMLNYLVAGDDDDGNNEYDKIPPWVRERNMIIMNPVGKGYIMIPLPYGYNVPYLTGQQLMSTLRGATKPLDAAYTVGSAAVESFNPIGAASSFAQLVSPTILDPFVQTVENQTWFGTPIYPKKWNENQPDSELYFATAPWWAKETARIINSATGGNVGREGLISWSPETIEHYFDFIAAGPIKFAERAINTGTGLVTGDEWLPEKTPILRRFYSTPTSASKRSEFYAAWDEVDAAYYEVSKLAKSGELEEARAVRQRYKPEIAAHGMMEKSRDALAALRDAKDAINADDNLAWSERRKKLDAITEREKIIVERTLSVYARLKKKTGR
ncbi:MAG: LPD38 domain-containing protein [Methyloceanibacter sp.]